MIPVSRKFPLRLEFLTFRTRAKKTALSPCTMYYVPSTKASRLAVIVPKKVNKHATTRNWLRRLTYDLVWPLIRDKNLDLVIVYKPLSLTKSPAVKHTIISELKSQFMNLKS